MMFALKKTIILAITFLFLLSTTVLATYAPTVETTWGDFAEKTSVTKDIISGQEYSFSVLSEKHTFKAVITSVGASTEFKTLLQVFIDNGNVISPGGLGGVTSDSNQPASYTFTKKINGVDITFDVSAGSYYGFSKTVAISTNGVKKEALVSPVNPVELTTDKTVKTFILAQDSVAQFFMKGEGGGVDTVPFTLVYKGGAGADITSHSFNIAFGYYFNQVGINGAKANTAEITGVKIGVGNPVVVVSDNFGNKYFVNLKVKKYDVINGFKVITIEVSGGQTAVMPVVHSTNLNGLDFSVSTTSAQVLFGDSNAKTTWYGPLMVGSQKYYFKQEYNSIKSEFVLKYFSNPFVSGGAFSTYPIAITIPVPQLVGGSTVGTPSLGKATVFSLLNEKGVKSNVYFVPIDFEPDGKEQSGAGSIRFFIGGKTVYDKTFPTLLSVEAPALLLTPGLPGQQLPGIGADTQQVGGVGACAGKANGLVLKSDKPGESLTLCANGFPVSCDVTSQNIVKTAGTVSFLCQYFKGTKKYAWVECTAADDGSIGGQWADSYGSVNAYTKNFMCGSYVKASKTYEAWYACPLKSKPGSDAINVESEKNGYVCYNDEWTLKSKVLLEGDLDKNGVVNAADIAWIKANPKPMWDEKLKKNIVNLNALINAMIKNWSPS